MKWAFGLLLLCNLHFIFVVGDGYYLATVPKIGRIGQNLDVVVQLLQGFTKQISISVGLKGYNPLVQDADPQTEKELLLSLPLSADMPADANYKLTVELSEKDTGTTLFTNTTQVYVESAKLAIMIQTDKGIYKPSQTVKIRVVGLGPDLKVAYPTMTLTITDANKNKLKQWRNLSHQSGIVSREFEISDRPPLGNWKIEAAITPTEKQSVKIVVDEYVLPRFEVLVNVPPALIKGQPISVVIEAKYTYGKGVNGKGQVTNNGKVRKDFKMVDGKATVSFSVKDMERVRGVATFTATVTDDTDMTLEGTGQAPVFDKKHKVTCLESTDKVAYPGTPFSFAFKVSDHGGLPIPSLNGKRMTVSYSFESRGSNTDEVITIPENGIVKGSIDVPTKANAFNLRANYDSVSDSCKGMVYESVSKVSLKIEPVMTPGMSTTPGSVPTYTADNDAIFKITASELVDTVFYEVLSRGTIQLSGYEEMTRLSQEITIRLTSLMAPQARLLAYCLNSRNNELIMTEMNLNIDGAFRNKVKVSFSEPRKRAGQNVTLKVEADGGSFVGIVAADKSVELLKEGNDFDQARVLKELEEFSLFKDEKSNDGPVPVFRKRRSIWYQSPTKKGAGNILENAGLKFMTNAEVHEVEDYNSGGQEIHFMFDAAAPDIMLKSSTGFVDRTASTNLAPVTHVRKFFPETWLWTDSRIA